MQGAAAPGRRRRRPRRRAGAHRVGQRAVRRRRPPAHDHPRRLGVHRLPARAPCTTAPRASSTTSPTTRCSASTAGTTPSQRSLRDDLVADLWDSQPGRRTRRKLAAAGAGVTLALRGRRAAAAADRRRRARHRTGRAPRGDDPNCAGDHDGRRPRRRRAVPAPPHRGRRRRRVGRAHRPAHARAARRVAPSSPGGPVWPGGIGAHDNGSLHVVFGNHAHRLDADLRVLASRTLPRERPVQQLRHAARRPPRHQGLRRLAARRRRRSRTSASRASCSCSSPNGLEIVARLVLPEPSIARLSADGDDIYVVGDTSLLRVRWDGAALTLDDAFTRRLPHPRRPDLRLGLRDRRRRGVVPRRRRRAASASPERSGATASRPRRCTSCASTSTTGEVTMVEICGRPGGLVANPPVVDERRGIVVGYDSGNGVLAAFDLDDARRRAGGATRTTPATCCSTPTPASSSPATTPTSSSSTSPPATSWPAPTPAAACSRVLFPAPGFERDFYVCTFLSLSRVSRGAP